MIDVSSLVWIAMDPSHFLSRAHVILGASAPVPIEGMARQRLRILHAPHLPALLCKERSHRVPANGHNLRYLIALHLHTIFAAGSALLLALGHPGGLSFFVLFQ
ncbi:hypothetical protein [Acidovorax sp.]|uniref:hypothetical protein n=1 Tax=Acidovorax sp. TaxID=1872122 RepID=UPI0026058666|nr:hypothetical protein [Acidovorax sp.]